MIEKHKLFRIAHDASGKLIIDDTQKAQSRGAYLCKSLSCYQKAVKTKGLERSLRRTIPPEFYEQLASKYNATNE